MIDSQSFSFSITIFSVLFGILLVVACLIVSWIALKRTNFKLSHVILELLRLGLVSLVALAICQPEWLQKLH